MITIIEIIGIAIIYNVISFSMAFLEVLKDDSTKKDDKK